jgi:hypothetical protein
LGLGYTEGTRQAGAEQRVQQDRGWLGFRERLDRPRPPCPCRLRRIRPRLGQRRDADRRAHVRQRARGDIAVAAVVAGAAQDQDVVRSRQTADGVGDCGAGAVHERFDRDAGGDHRVFGGAHFGGGQDGLAFDSDHEGLAAPLIVAGRR